MPTANQQAYPVPQTASSGLSDEPVVVVASSSNLTAERVLSAVPPLIAQDPGAGGTIDFRVHPTHQGVCRIGSATEVQQSYGGTAALGGTPTGLVTEDGTAIQCVSTTLQCGLPTPTNLTLAGKFRMLLMVQIPRSNNIRVFVGVSNTSMASGTDTPTNNNFAVVRFAPGAGDTTFGLLTRQTSTAELTATSWESVADNDRWEFDFLCDLTNPNPYVSVRARRKASGGSWGAWSGWTTKSGGQVPANTGYDRVMVGQSTDGTSTGITLHRWIGGQCAE